MNNSRAGSHEFPPCSIMSVLANYKNTLLSCNFWSVTYFSVYVRIIFLILALLHNESFNAHKTRFELNWNSQIEFEVEEDVFPFLDCHKFCARKNNFYIFRTSQKLQQVFT